MDLALMSQQLIWASVFLAALGAPEARLGMKREQMFPEVNPELVDLQRFRRLVSIGAEGASEEGVRRWCSLLLR